MLHIQIFSSPVSNDIFRRWMTLTSPCLKKDKILSSADDDDDDNDDDADGDNMMTTKTMMI